MKTKMLRMTENKNLNMCYDKWFKIKMKGTKEISSLEQNGFVNWASESWKKTKYGIFPTYLKTTKRERDFQRLLPFMKLT